MSHTDTPNPATAQDAMSIRLAMAAEGWESHDRITWMGWGDSGPGYKIWFERSDWHGKNSYAMIGHRACYHSSTSDFDRIDIAVARAAERARRAYKEFPDTPPVQSADDRDKLIPHPAADYLSEIKSRRSHDL